jgi:hypothetical protein
MTVAEVQGSGFRGSAFQRFRVKRFRGSEVQGSKVQSSKVQRFRGCTAFEISSKIRKGIIIGSIEKRSNDGALF